MASDKFISYNLKTLLMSLSGILLGALLAAADYHVNWWVVLLITLSVVCLQVFTNVVPGIIMAFAAVWVSYGTIFSLDSLILLLFGYFVYRLVKNHSPEDGLFRNGLVVTLTSLVIYGLLPIYGIYFICTHSFGSPMLLLPAFSIGALCLSATNAGYVQERTTRLFHTLWILAGFVLMTVYSCLRISDPWHFLFLLLLPVFIWMLVRIWRNEPEESYEMKMAALILLFALLTGLGFTAYLF